MIIVIHVMIMIMIMMIIRETLKVKCLETFAKIGSMMGGPLSGLGQYSLKLIFM